MDPLISWYQPEQRGPALDLWNRIWECSQQYKGYETQQTTQTAPLTLSLPQGAVLPSTFPLQLQQVTPILTPASESIAQLLPIGAILQQQSAVVVNKSSELCSFFLNDTGDQNLLIESNLAPQDELSLADSRRLLNPSPPVNTPAYIVQQLAAGLEHALQPRKMSVQPLSLPPALDYIPLTTPASTPSPDQSTNRSLLLTAQSGIELGCSTTTTTSASASVGELYTAAATFNGAYARANAATPSSNEADTATSTTGGDQTPLLATANNPAGVAASSNKRKRDNRASTFDFDAHKQDYCGEFGGTPWIPAGRSYSYGLCGLHEEILDFADYIKPTNEEQAVREEAFKRIKSVIVDLWPCAVVDYFGSFRTGLYLPTSDIDVVVIGNWEVLPLWTLEKALKSFDIAEETTIKVLDKASVPIIKYTDKRTDIRVDVSFNMLNGVKSAKLITGFMTQYPPLSPLVYVLKQFLLQRNLNEVFTGGISSYCLILMAISFLQLHPNHLVASIRLRDVNLGVLLVEFFELYGRHFNYSRTGVRIRSGGAYMLKEILMPRSVAEAGAQAPLLCLEDPLQPGNDIGRSSYGIVRVRQAFEYAFLQLAKLLHFPNKNLIRDNGSYLARIIRVTDDVVRYRQEVHERYEALNLGGQFFQHGRATLLAAPAAPNGTSTNADATAPPAAAVSYAEAVVSRAGSEKFSDPASSRVSSPTSDLSADGESDVDEDSRGVAQQNRSSAAVAAAAGDAVATAPNNSDESHRSRRRHATMSSSGDVVAVNSQDSLISAATTMTAAGDGVCRRDSDAATRGDYDSGAAGGDRVATSSRRPSRGSSHRQPHRHHWRWWKPTVSAPK